ncbi:MAG TPA: pitrilysin family protein [Dissulfurispiraceae bacterium]|nr:pitrilysin family protein [Dissulfurispiraceae bacterium]
MNKPKIILLLFVMLCVAFAAPLPANAISIKKEKLPNGLTVLYVERHELPIVMATILVKASPLEEEAVKAGTANLAAMMLTEGTATRKSGDISGEIDFIGGSLHAATNSDYTTVSLSILKKDIDKGFDLFSDVVMHPSFPADELARKKELVKGSLKQREEEPGFIAGREFIKDVFGSHPYGRLAEGSVASINGIERSDIVNFYDAFYRPENAILAVVGDLSPEELKKLLDRYFVSWKPGEKRAVAITTPVPTVLEKPGMDIIDKDVTQANIVFGGLGIARDNPDYYAVSVMNYVLGGGGFASRLMRVIRDEMGLTYSINSFFAAGKYPGRFEVEVQTKNESAGRVIDEMLKQIKLMKSDLISDAELRDARDYLIGSFPRRLETSRKIADFLVAVQYYNLGDDYIDKYKEYIEKVSREDVLRVAKKYLDDKNYVLVIVGNKKKLKLDIR